MCVLTQISAGMFFIEYIYFSYLKFPQFKICDLVHNSEVSCCNTYLFSNQLLSENKPYSLNSTHNFSALKNLQFRFQEKN